MLGAMDRRFKWRLFKAGMPDGVCLVTPARVVLTARLNTNRVDPLKVFTHVPGIGFWIWIVAFGKFSDFAENNLGLDLIPDNYFVAFVVIWLGGFFGLTLVGYLIARRMMTTRVRRFFEAPHCYHCLYELPELITSPDEIVAGARHIQCPECGEYCQRVGIERHAADG